MWPSREGREQKRGGRRQEGRQGGIACQRGNAFAGPSEGGKKKSKTSVSILSFESRFLPASRGGEAAPPFSFCRRGRGTRDARDVPRGRRHRIAGRSEAKKGRQSRSRDSNAASAAAERERKSRDTAASPSLPSSSTTTALHRQ